MILQKNKEVRELSDRKTRFYNFLLANPIGVLSSVTPDNNPHGTVVYFCVDKDFVCSFITKSGTKKNDNIKHNNHVMLTVFDPKTQTTVQILGFAQEIRDSRRVNAIAGSIVNTSIKTARNLPPLSKLDAGQFVGYEIVPVEARMATYASSNTGHYKDIFKSIEYFGLEDGL